MSLKVQFLDVSAKIIPADKFYTFSTGGFLCRFRKNNFADVPFYTMEVFAANGRTFVFANKLVYGQEFVDSLLAPFRDKLIPLNIDYEATGLGPTELTDETFGTDIRIVSGIIET